MLLLATGERASMRTSCKSDCVEAAAAAGSAARCMIVSTKVNVSGVAPFSTRRWRMICKPSRTFTHDSTVLAMTRFGIVPRLAAARKQCGAHFPPLGPRLVWELLGLPVALDRPRVVRVEELGETDLTKRVLRGGQLRPVGGRQPHDFVEGDLDILRV